MTGNTQMVSSLKTYENHFAVFSPLGVFKCKIRRGQMSMHKNTKADNGKPSYWFPLCVFPALLKKWLSKNLPVLTCSYGIIFILLLETESETSFRSTASLVAWHLLDPTSLGTASRLLTPPCMDFDFWNLIYHFWNPIYYFWFLKSFFWFQLHFRNQK